MSENDIVIITDGIKTAYTNKFIKNNLEDNKTILRIFRKIDNSIKVSHIERRNITQVDVRNNRNSKYFYKCIKVESLLSSIDGMVSFRFYIYDFKDYFKKL